VGWLSLQKWLGEQGGDRPSSAQQVPRLQSTCTTLKIKVLLISFFPAVSQLCQPPVMHVPACHMLTRFDPVLMPLPQAGAGWQTHAHSLHCSHAPAKSLIMVSCLWQLPLHVGPCVLSTCKHTALPELGVTARRSRFPMHHSHHVGFSLSAFSCSYSP